MASRKPQTTPPSPTDVEHQSSEDRELLAAIQEQYRRVEALETSIAGFKSLIRTKRVELATALIDLRSLLDGQRTLPFGAKTKAPGPHKSE